MEANEINYLNSSDEELLGIFQKERQLSDRTMYGYHNAMGLYCKFNNMHLKELLEEADNEEDEGIRWKKSKLKQKLLNFRTYLTENYLHGTVKVHFGRIKTFYNHFEIEIGYLPKINIKSVTENEPIRFDDLLTPDEIQTICDKASPLIKAITLFCISSGCARREMLNITIDDFIEATSDYHSNGSIHEVIAELLTQKDIVPMFKIRRQKTNKYYYTFCSPEAVQSICIYLVSSGRKFKGYNEDKLFKINLDYLNDKFSDLNNELKLGKVGGYNKLRTHMFRKFNASHLYDDGMTMDDIDALQGRSKDNTRQAYFKDNPLKLREKYVEHLGAVTIYE